MTPKAHDRLTRLTADLLAVAGSGTARPDGAAVDEKDYELQFTGPETVLASSYRVTDAAAALVAAVSIAVARIAALRSPDGSSPSEPRKVTVDTVEACAAFQSERHFRLAAPARLWDELSGHYPTADGHIQFHTNFPHHRAALLAATGCRPDGDRAAVEKVVARSGRFELERSVSEAGGIAAALRTVEEWQRHTHAAHVAGRKPLVIHRRSTGRARPLGTVDPARPLQGLRVLDLTRVIAGPVSTRTLAAYGADVLRIGAETLPVVDSILPDTTLGKRFADCDITTPAGRDLLLRLAADADVVVSGFRPGALAARGLGTDDLLEANSELVVAGLDAYGMDGPWGGRRGFDSIVQTATGVVATETAAFNSDRPRPLPCQLLDHGSGFLLALGVLVGLGHRQTIGGAHEISVSLLTTRNWLDALGPADPGAGREITESEVARCSDVRRSPFGDLRHIRHPGRIAGIASQWERGPSRPGSDPARW